MDLIGEFSTSSPYTFHVKQVSYNATEEVRVFGNYPKGKSNRDVQWLEIKDLHLEKFPRGIRANFPSLTGLRIDSCGIKKICHSDFVGLSNLHSLSLNGNLIEELSRDVFVNLRYLINLHMRRNLIKFIHPKAFDPLTELRLLDLRENSSIDAQCLSLDKAILRKEMMEEIANCCKPLSAHDEKIESRLNDFEAQLALMSNNKLSEENIASRMSAVEQRLSELELQMTNILRILSDLVGKED